MSALMQILSQALSGGATESIAGQVGADQAKVESAVGLALPVLIGALSRNAASPAGAQALEGALDRDHSGSLLDGLGSLLGGGSGAGGLGALGAILGGGAPAPTSASAGEAILGHVLGNRQAAVQQQIGQASGLDQRSVAQILALLAPIVMAALGRARGQAGGTGVQDILGGAQAQVQQAAPGAGGFLTSLLDRDGDGSVTDDMAQMGMSVLGSLLSGKR